MKSPFILLLCVSSCLHAEALRIPAHTAYSDPDADRGARFSQDKPITGWSGEANKILWFGEIKKPGKLECALDVTLPAGKASKLRLTVAGKAKDFEVKGTGATPVHVAVGTFDIPKAGYQRFQLESLNKGNGSNGEIGDLTIDGPAAEGAHFNMKERRNAASVHLSYENPKGVNVVAFYCEATAVLDPLYSYYMVCGWNKGYLGMQVNGPTERRIIFSVWDSGDEARDRNKVGDENRTKLVAKGEGVEAGDFGNEGTGGHSHLAYNWKTGSTQRFLVTAKVTDPTHTIYTGYWFHPDKKQWMIVSSWNAPKTGMWLEGLYSFSENFGGQNGYLQRKCLYGNQWVRTDEGKWIEITRASFSHDGTGKQDRLDRYMGVESGRFFLSQGGFVDGPAMKFGTSFDRPAGKVPPSDLKLPPLPGEK